MTDVREVWARYPYALPSAAVEVSLPDPDALERFFLSDMARFQHLREAHVKRMYIGPLIENPHDHLRRIELAQTKIESEDFNDAITAALPLLDTDYRASAYYLIGCAYAGQNDLRAAAVYFKKALEHDPENQAYASGLAALRAALKRASGP